MPQGKTHPLNAHRREEKNIKQSVGWAMGEGEGGGFEVGIRPNSRITLAHALGALMAVEEEHVHRAWAKITPSEDGGLIGSAYSGP